ncbi:hypothetical protein RHO13_04545 [Orbus wheelerorum]|uniref:hypothetical protein n=1 Tax=Orbus wheelerorum TaxID=3074111 RepID=UPI00370D74E2
MQLFSTNKNNTKLFTNNNQGFIDGKLSSLRIAIVSTNTQLINDIRAILFLYNALSIEVLSLEFDDMSENNQWVNFDIFIIDIKKTHDAEKISTTINRFIPIKASTILIGENDSITFAELLAKQGIYFLLKDKQLERIPNILSLHSSTQTKPSKRVGSVISFLACKGGIGTSTLIVNLLKNISKSINYPILYVQGSTTSQNADFLFETPIDKDGLATQVTDSLQVKIEQDDEIDKHDYLDSGSFNITILDQNIGLRSYGNKLEGIISLSNIIFLIINRDPYSIKVAKDALEQINNMVQKDSLIQDKRFLICLNDNKPIDKKPSLQNIDIEEYLGRPIDFTCKYIPTEEKLKKAYLTKEIENIATAVIGLDNKNKKHSFLMPFINKMKK